MAKIFDFPISKAAGIDDVDWYKKGIDAIKNSPDATDIVNFFLNYIVTEIEIGLGLIEVDDDLQDLKFFEEIDNLYNRAAGGCLFCDKSIDPNEISVGPETKICATCKIKLKKFSDAIGVSGVFK